MKDNNDTATLQRMGSVGWLIFDGEKNDNTLSINMLRAALEQFTLLENDQTIRAIVIRGAGTRAFISGGEISSPEYRQLSDDFRSRVSRCQKPVIAMINGSCFGAGLAIALCADVRIASETARFNIPAAQRGISYPMTALSRLVEFVGASASKDILMSARDIEADEAVRMGLINHARKPEELESYTAFYALRIAGNAPLSIKAVKLFVSQLGLPEAERDHSAIAAMQEQIATSEDAKEGRRALDEGRAPHFRGV